VSRFVTICNTSRFADIEGIEVIPNPLRVRSPSEAYLAEPVVAATDDSWVLPLGPSNLFPCAIARRQEMLDDAVSDLVAYVLSNSRVKSLVLQRILLAREVPLLL
jgi:hypothetical protein